MNSSGNVLISVIIPSYNSAAFVGEAVESALAQTYSPVEVIVIDDGSIDETAAVLSPYMERIRYVRQENRGLAGARNRGIQEARGEWLALLDADDQWQPGKLARSLAKAQENPEVALVHTDVTYFDGATGETVKREVDRSIHHGNCYLKLFRANAVLPSTVVMRRDVVVALGGFDDSLRRVEDWDLWLRIARRHPFAFVAEPLTRYRLHGASLTANSRKMRESELYVVRKTLAADPELANKVGAEEIRRKLFDLCFSLGYDSFQEGEFAAARKYFVEALAQRRFSPYTRALWLATWFPAGVIEPMRRMKQALGARLSPTEDK